MTLYSISFFGVLVYSIYRLDRFDWNPVTITGIFRPFYKDDTIFGATSALVATFWIAYGLTRKILTSKILFLFLGLIFLGCVILSTSRAAIISVIIFVIVWFALRLRMRLIKHVVIGFLSVSLMLFIFRSQVYNILIENKHLSHNSQLDYMEQLESSSNISSDISNKERINRWIAGLGMFKEKPLFGYGPGTYQFVYIPFQHQKFMNKLTVRDPWHIPENSGGTAHSEYLLAISEMGMTGIFAFLILLGRWIWIAFEGSLNHAGRGKIIIIFAILSTYLFHALFNNFLTTDKFAFLFWGLAAWMVTIYKFQTVSTNGVL
jgi:O-antigen ligase